MEDTRMDIGQRLDTIETFPAFVKETILAAEGDELVDVLGAVNSTQTAIGSIKRTAASEVGSGTSGKRWSYEQGRKAIRSYNTNNMLAKMMTQLDFRSLPALLGFLQDEGVISISWRWTPLQKLIRQKNLEFAVARHEIVDGDPQWDMGEYWEAGAASYKAVTSDG